MKLVTTYDELVILLENAKRYDALSANAATMDEKLTYAIIALLMRRRARLSIAVID